MSRVASLVSDFVADDRVFQRVSARVDATMRGISGRMTAGIGVVNGAFASMGVALAGALSVVGLFTKQASDAETQNVRLAAVLNATGHAAGFTTSQLDAFAKQMQSVTKFEDDATKGALAVLATFRNINGDNFLRAAKAAMNLATVTGEDLESAMRKVGRALNQPKSGLNALRATGVAFTEQQKKQIIALDQLGLSYAAQSIILKQLEKSYGGAAEAAGNTFAGQLQILKNEVGDLAEDIGNLLLPHLTKLVRWVRGFVPAVAEWIAQSTALRAALQGIIDVVKGIPDAFNKAVDTAGFFFEDLRITAEITFLKIQEFAIDMTQSVVASVTQMVQQAITNLKGLKDFITSGGKQFSLDLSTPQFRTIPSNFNQQRIAELEEQRRNRSSPAIKEENRANQPGAPAPAEVKGGLSPFKMIEDAIDALKRFGETAENVAGNIAQNFFGAMWKEAGRRAKLVEPRVGGFSGLVEMSRSLQAAAISDPKKKEVELLGKSNDWLGKIFNAFDQWSKKKTPLFSS